MKNIVINTAVADLETVCLFHLKAPPGYNPLRL